MFTVIGIMDNGEGYAVRVDSDHTGHRGVIVEAVPDRVTDLLDVYVGQTLTMPGTFAAGFDLDYANAESVLVALSALTDVRQVTGDVPVLVDESHVPPGAVV